MTFDLDQILSGQVFAFMVLFTRLAAGLMMFPGIGETFVEPRLRMLFALATTFLLLPVLHPLVPVLPPNIADWVRLLAMESLIGLFFGLIMRLFLSVIEGAGSLIAMEIGLSNAMVLNPSLGNQSALTSAFMSVAATTLIFVTGLDHFLLQALLDTYKVFPVGGVLPLGEMTQTFIVLFSKSFILGVQLASPFIIVGLLMYVMMGIMQKLMPQVQLFLILLPAQIWGGLFVFSLTLSIIMTVWLQMVDETTAKLFIR